MTIYGNTLPLLQEVMQQLANKIDAFNRTMFEATGHHAYEHLSYRIKSDESMREKCDRKGLPQTEESALGEIKDAIGLRIITRFVDDIYKTVDFVKTIDGCTVVKEKDYVKNAKPNGYRSYHMILSLQQCGRTFYAELQLRTIAMDSWAALEHEMTYKKSDINNEMIASELKRCADELASCDITMQTIRDLIRADEI